MAHRTLLSRRLNKSVAQRMEAQHALQAALQKGAALDQATAQVILALQEQWPRMSKREAQQLAQEAVQAREPYTAPLDGSPPAWAKALVRRARQIDRKHGRDGTITVDEVLHRFRQQGGRCCLSGIAFTPEPFFPSALVARPFAPSLDQKNPRGGYAADNVQLACTAANFAKHSWDVAVLRTLAEGVVRTMESQKEEAGGKSVGDGIVL